MVSQFIESISEIFRWSGVTVRLAKTQLSKPLRGQQTNSKL